MTDNEEIQELRRSTTSHPDISMTGAGDTSDLQNEIGVALTAIDAGEASKMIGFRDQHVAALLIAAETRNESFQELGNRLARSVGREERESFTRSEIIRLAVRAGLQQAAPGHYERLTAATTQHARDTL
jgi:hypothetical protein